MTGKIDVTSDVVEETDKFTVSPKTQLKMQVHHQLMLNIQNISKIIRDTENAISRYAMILKSMEENKEQPHYWFMGDFMIPVTDHDGAVEHLNGIMDKLTSDLDKHIAQVKAMQKQHDGLTDELDLMLEVEKGKFKAGQQVKAKNARRRNR